jgi:hypothetical protein
MYARVTQLEIDSLRVCVADAVAQYEREVIPALHEQPGYRGVVVLTTGEGKAVLVSFWDTEEQARTESPFYESVLAKFVTLFRAPPGRDAYEVALVDGSALARIAPT